MAVNKQILLDLARDESLNNKHCVDCGSPGPQWATISFAAFICLQCAGAHRAFGVHVSFVRSISMDTWQDDQLRRMQLGGNAPLMDFLRNYSPDGGYTDSMSTHDKYHCWAATQYREKLTATLQGSPWSPSPPPAPAPSPPPTNALRKSRASSRPSPSPSPRPSPSPAPTPPTTNNESFFASLGASNAARPDTLPPSQGGRYTGFGSTPSPSSSPAPTPIPSLAPTTEALARTWSLLASTATTFSASVRDRINDPQLREYVARAADAAGSANAWGRERFGVDVKETVGAAVDRVRGGPAARGYEAVAKDYGEGDGAEEGSAVCHDIADDAFFRQEAWRDEDPQPRPPPKKDEWDEWKDF